MICRIPVLLVCLLSILCCKSKSDNSLGILNPEGDESTKEGKMQKDSAKELYKAELYFAATGTNVDSIRKENGRRNLALKQLKRKQMQSRTGAELFADGLIEATWHERGPDNEAGDMRVIDFDPATEDFYAISTVGHLWKGNLDGQTWSLLRDDINFEPDEIEVLPHNGGNRLFAIYGNGIDDKKIKYSDDEGKNWTSGTGFTFYDHWGKGRRLYPLSDNQTLYYLVHTWQANPWGQVMQLYKSTDKGVSYSKVWNSPIGYSGEDVDLWKPYDSDQMYLVDNRAQNYYKVTHNFTTGASEVSTAKSFAGQGIAVGGIHLSGRYKASAQDYELFLINDEFSSVYKSNNGSNWTFLSTCPENVWVKGWMADPDNENLYVGGFQLNKTSNGLNWTENYPQWWLYYSSSKEFMHVDIMNLDYFKKSDGTPFIIALNHAGVYVTYNNFGTTKNLGLKDLNVVTLYDQSTASDGFLYCGAQDKGNFKYSGNSLENFNQISTDNMSTADGMLGVFFNSDQSFYAMIQNGGIMCFRDRENKNYAYYDIPGTSKPGWINPIVPTPDFSDNKAYVAGGDLNGGNGSYLMTIDVDISGANVEWNNTQFDYNFRSNSNSGTSVIKAIGVSYIDFDRLYVATQDASFFSSNNQGSSWAKSATANLPNTMIPWDIKTSAIDPDVVFVCGTGFSNTGVFQSLDGGKNFVGLLGNIPLATFYEVALTADEKFLYAATSEGPYVYVFAESQWFPLMGANTPILDYNSVDIVSDNVVRFGTYGRGVWDFEIDAGTSTSISDQGGKKSDSTFSVFPTLLTESKMIQIVPSIPESYSIELYSLEGKLMLTQKASGISSIRADFPRGVYLYNIRSQKSKMAGRIVVQ